MLGPISVSVNGARIALDLGRSGRLLAGFLFEFPGQVNRRERLADMLWGDRDPDHARAALSTALWRIRKLLSSSANGSEHARLRCNQHEVVLEPGAWLDVDTRAFSDLARKALRVQKGAAASAEPDSLEKAVAMYSGAFLHGDDADWVVAERERLHSLYIRCLCELVRLYASTEDYGPAIDVARRVLSEDPFREGVARTLALLLFLDGCRVQAIRELDRWIAALRGELDVDPLPETVALRAALVSGEIGAQAEKLKSQYFTGAFGTLS